MAETTAQPRADPLPERATSAERHERQTRACVVIEPKLTKSPLMDASCRPRTNATSHTHAMTTELERRLLADDPAQLAAYLESHAKPSLSEKFYHLLIRAQLDDWIQEQTGHAMHSSALHSHVLTLLDWEPAATAAAATAVRSLTLAELFSMFRGASLCHDDRLQYELEICLVEFKRHLWLDRLVHHTPLDELDAWLRRLFPMAFPSTGDQTRVPAALAGLDSVWFHQPSVEAVAAEEEVAGELQSLLESGAEHDAVVEYCTKYPLRSFIQQAIQWLNTALAQWKTKHGIAATSAPPATATAKSAKQTAQARAKAASNAAAAAAASSASSAQSASAAKPAAVTRAGVAAPSSSSSWPYDSLTINALEVESLLTPASYASYPLDILSPDELEPSGNSSNGGSQEEGKKESDTQRSERKALELRKAALLKAIHQQTHPEVVAFLRRELVAASAPVPAKTPRKAPAVLYTSFSELMHTMPATPPARTSKKRALNPTDAAAASSVAVLPASAAAAAAASSAAASSFSAPAVPSGSAPAAAPAAAVVSSSSPSSKRPRRAAAAAAVADPTAASSKAIAAAPMDLDDAEADADDEPDGSEESKEEPRTQAQDDTEEGADANASAAAAKSRPAPYKPLAPAVGIKAFFNTAARPTAAPSARSDFGVSLQQIN